MVHTICCVYVVSIKCKNYHFPSENFEVLGRGLSTISGNSGWDLKPESAQVVFPWLFHTSSSSPFPSDFPAANPTLKRSYCEGCVRGSVSWKQTEQKWENLVFVLQIWAVATKMQSHTQVYLSRNTMVPKNKTIVVPGPRTLLKGTCVGSLVPVAMGRGKNVQRVGGD